MRNISSVLVSAFLLTVYAAIVAGSREARATIREVLEPMYAELTIAIKSGDFDNALKLAEDIIAKDPNAVQALELRALALRSAGRNAEASKAYLELVKKRWKESTDKTVVAPYYFELGGLRFKEQKLDEAKFYFQHSLDWNFNPTVSRFFLGNIAIQQKDYGAAGEHFGVVAKGEIEDLKGPAEFFLAQVAFKRRKPSLAIGHLRETKRIAEARIADPAVTDENKATLGKLLDTANKALEPLDKASFFGNITLLTGYDSNVLSVPLSQASSAETTGNGSLKETLLGAFGYATSPLRKIQLVPSYRLSYNYNFNKDTRTGSFLAQTVSVAANVDALEPVSYGFKVEGTHTFQNQPDSTTDNSVYKPYALSGTIGPFAKVDFENLITLNGELVWQPQKNYADSTTTDSYRRSGNEGVARVTGKRDGGDGYLNPALTLVYDRNRTNGTEYRSKTLGFTLADTMYVNERTTAGTSLSYSHIAFDERDSGERDDKLIVFDTNASYRLTDAFTILADLQLMRNISTVPESYEFNRTQLSGGISYSF